MIAKWFSTMVARVLGGISLALLLACVGLLFRGNHYLHQRDKARSELAQMQAANREATARQIAANLAVEATYKRKAEETDARYQVALDSARSASERYAAQHRVPAYHSSSRPPAPTPDQPPESPDRPSGTAVVVPKHDFDIMVENSVRLQAAHEWAKTLVQEPLPVPAFGPAE